MLELIAVAVTVAILGGLSLTGLGKSILAPTAVEKSLTVGGPITETNSTGKYFLKAEDCTKLTVVAFKAPPTSIKYVSEMGGTPQVLAQTHAQTGAGGGPCVYSMKVPAGETIALSVLPGKLGSTGAPAFSKFQKTDGASVTVPSSSNKGQADDESPKEELSIKTIFVKGEIKTIKTVPTLASVPLIVETEQ